jgi:hypothetical protein
VEDGGETHFRRWPAATSTRRFCRTPSSAFGKYRLCGVRTGDVQEFLNGKTAAVLSRCEKAVLEIQQRWLPQSMCGNNAGIEKR